MSQIFSARTNIDTLGTNTNFQFNWKPDFFLDRVWLVGWLVLLKIFIFSQPTFVSIFFAQIPIDFFSPKVSFNVLMLCSFSSFSSLLLISPLNLPQHGVFPCFHAALRLWVIICPISHAFQIGCILTEIAMRHLTRHIRSSEETFQPFVFITGGLGVWGGGGREGCRCLWGWFLSQWGLEVVELVCFNRLYFVLKVTCHSSSKNVLALDRPWSSLSNREHFCLPPQNLNSTQTAVKSVILPAKGTI